MLLGFVSKGYGFGLRLMARGSLRPGLSGRRKGVSPIIYNYFSPVPAAGEAFVAGVFVLARDKGSMAGNLVACVLLS